MAVPLRPVRSGAPRATSVNKSPNAAEAVTVPLNSRGKPNRANGVTEHGYRSESNSCLAGTTSQHRRKTFGMGAVHSPPSRAIAGLFKVESLVAQDRCARGGAGLLRGSVRFPEDQALSGGSLCSPRVKLLAHSEGANTCRPWFRQDGRLHLAGPPVSLCRD